jgi:hypothetical protein
VRFSRDFRYGLPAAALPQPLQCLDVVTIFQQIGCKRNAKGVGCRGPHCPSDGSILGMNYGRKAVAAATALQSGLRPQGILPVWNVECRWPVWLRLRALRGEGAACFQVPLHLQYNEAGYAAISEVKNGFDPR